MILPPPGAVVAWWDGAALAFGLAAGEEKQRLKVVRPGGGEERVPPGRLAYVVEPSGVAPGRGDEGRLAAARRAAAVEARVREAAAAVEVPELWQLARESDGPLAPDALAELAVGGKDGESRAVLALALVEEGIHFVRRGEGFEPRPPEAVAGILRQRARDARRKVEKEEALALLRRAAAGPVEAPPGNEELDLILRSLEELAVHDLETSEKDRARALEALAAWGARWDRPDEGAFRLLRRFGRLGSDDANVQVLRYGLRTEFPAEVLRAAGDAAAGGFSREGREDLSGLEIVTIDSAATREVDDGLSARPLEDGAVELGIHIADPAAFVAPGDPVDLEALARATTHYLPDMRLTMLPPALAEEAASLLPGVDRPALSFLAEVGPEGTVRAFRAARSLVRVARRWSYAEADAALAAGDPVLSALAGAAAALERGRVEAGAVRLAAPEVDVHVEPDGRIVLERPDPRSPSRALVSEMMIAAGALAARFLKERRVPAIWRRQPPPAAPVDASSVDPSDPVAVRALRRQMRRGEIGLEPGPHFGLGLPAYVQATSPLRRYQDLAVHRQIAAALDGQPPPHDREDLRRIAGITDRAEAEGRRAEQASERYWLLRWVQERAAAGEDVLSGTVVDTEMHVVVQLDQTLLEERVPALAGAAAPGDRVRLQVERVNPRADLLVLRPVLASP